MILLLYKLEGKDLLMAENSMTNIVYLSLGSNIGDREKHLIDAIKLLKEDKHITLEKKSSIYETDPVGYEDQQPFLNMVVKISTTLQPMELLNKIQHIEKVGGRKRDIRWGPRTIDVDILLFNDEKIKTERLVVPHPRMFERRFVLVPLLEIMTKYKLKDGTNLEDHLNNLEDNEGVRFWKKL